VYDGNAFGVGSARVFVDDVSEIGQLVRRENALRRVDRDAVFLKTFQHVTYMLIMLGFVA